MEISVALLPRLIDPSIDLRHTCVVIIDVLRATTVMTTAGFHDALEIVTCADTETARRLASESAEPTVLGGERQCVKIAGFDHGNSPSEYTRESVAGKRVILTTTNGTAAIEKASKAGKMYCASFLNLSAIVRAVSRHPSICIVCAGTNGEISNEDVLLAGALVGRLTTSHPKRQTDDSSRLALSLWREATLGSESLSETVSASLRLSLGGRNLKAVGFDEDIDRCAAVNSVPGAIRRVASDPQTFEYLPSWKLSS